MRVAFVLPAVGKKPGESYASFWLMEPLAVAQLAGLTPPAWERVLYDDRLERIPYDEPTDLVAISVETYTARRAYQISERFRRRGVPVVMGGFHVTLVPDEVAAHADAIVVGEAECVWPKLLEDLRLGRLQKRYQAEQRPDLAGIFPDRAIYAGKKYMDLALVETGRGCRLSCDFCSITAFFKRSYTARPVEDVIKEVSGLHRRNVFFVDDNLAVDRTRTQALLKALAPLKIRWAGQVSVHVAADAELLGAMYESGCMGVLIGFESLEPGSPALAGKGLQGAASYDDAMERFAEHRIAVYGTFVFGYDPDTVSALRAAMDFASRHRLFFAAFNHLVPFPGTPLYRRLRDERRLLHEAWWLEPGYRFGDVAFKPEQGAPAELADICLQARRDFYAMPQVFKRALNWRCNCRDLFMTAVFLSSNLMSRREVDQRQGLPLGAPDE